MLIKHVEAFYADSITKDPQRKPHLESRWCIIDKHGDEKVVFEPFKHGYVVKDSVLYTMDSKYYNIETGVLYCYAVNHCESSEYVFLENRFDDDKTKRGVLKIHKKTGTVELFK